MSYHNLSALLEAIIYLAKDPVTVDAIRKAIPDVDRKEIDECVAALIHRRRAGVRRLSTKGDLVTLDTERAQHDAERKVHRLEDGSLLDV